ncbi:sensor histidine kinase [Brevibacterium jeotgali]|uniref:Signal transduction histidine kinase n=1 Tax=Brevibacterium jeotgali TaxID=1262550 RepID=A0A2H1L158_9MICO|nr:sensor histidine kinase [Brevibacterium jeotgali]TWC01993.1 signal transduction histidine kinase [Brevibacterium jeotgali]SMY10656.1 Signal transduction histidine kinase [Brevibacterium jeotgali]
MPRSSALPAEPSDGRASALTSTSVSVALQWGLHVLIVGLGLLVVVRALSGDASHPTAAIGLVVAFEALYVVGAVLAGRLVRLRLVRLRLVWVAALVILWLGTLALAPDAAFLAFPLFFLCFHLLRDWWGPLSVLAIALAAIAGLAFHRGLTVGGVTGPLVGAAVAVAIGLGVRTLVREVRARERLVTRLLTAQTRLAETERAAGVEAERTRMAAELHDTVAQGLSSIQLLLSAAERRMGPEAAGLHEIALAKSSAGSALAETRAFIRALNSPKLAAATLPDALARVVSETGSEASTAGFETSGSETSGSEAAGSEAASRAAAARAADLTFRTNGAARPLPRPVETTILRLVQGALGNAVSHAHADRVRVTLTYGHDRIAVDITDDGRGFDPSAVRPSGESDSFGLDVMRARARAVGGTLTVESRPGEGTTVRAVFDAGDEGSGV